MLISSFILCRHNIEDQKTYLAWRKRVKHLVEFPLEDGSSIVVEVDESETIGTIRAGRGDTIAKARETLEEALDKVLPAAKRSLRNYVRWAMHLMRSKSLLA